VLCLNFAKPFLEYGLFFSYSIVEALLSRQFQHQRLHFQNQGFAFNLTFLDLMQKGLSLLKYCRIGSPVG
jgi:hypothetical protein